MRRFIILLLLVATGQICAGQSEKKEKFKLKGKPILTIFANYHAGLGRANGTAGFALDRSYIGYEARVTERLSGKVVLDIGPTNVDGAALERVAYVKNAMLSWKTGDFTLDFGLVSTAQFKAQESVWGHRYLMKSFQDEHGFGSSADMGVLARYRVADWLEADATFINGEGYKKLNTDNKYRYGIGVTLTPVEGVTVRGYLDNADKNISGPGTKAQQTLAVLGGYESDRFTIGAEYNKQYNTDFREHQDREGFSVYSTARVSSRVHLFGRYDNHSSRKGWSDEDGQAMVFGVEYAPVKQLKIAPNFRNQNPGKGLAKSFIHINIEFKI